MNHHPSMSGLDRQLRAGGTNLALKMNIARQEPCYDEGIMSWGGDEDHEL